MQREHGNPAGIESIGHPAMDSVARTQREHDQRKCGPAWPGRTARINVF